MRIFQGLKELLRNTAGLPKSQAVVCAGLLLGTVDRQSEESENIGVRDEGTRTGLGDGGKKTLDTLSAKR